MSNLAFVFEENFILPFQLFLLCMWKAPAALTEPDIFGKYKEKTVGVPALFSLLPSLVL